MKSNERIEELEAALFGLILAVENPTSMTAFFSIDTVLSFPDLPAKTIAWVKSIPPGNIVVLLPSGLYYATPEDCAEYF